MCKKVMMIESTVSRETPFNNALEDKMMTLTAFFLLVHLHEFKVLSGTNKTTNMHAAALKEDS